MRFVVPTSAREAPRGFEDLGDLEASADRDELAARHEHCAPASDRGQREEDGGALLFTRDGVLRAEELARRAAHVVLATPASPLPARTRGSSSPRRSASRPRARLPRAVRGEVGVEQDPGRVDRPHERRGEAARQRLAGRAEELARLGRSAGDRGAQLLLDGLPPVEAERLGRSGRAGGSPSRGDGGRTALLSRTCPGSASWRSERGESGA